VLLDEPLTGVSEQAADELIPLLRSLAPTVLVTGPSAGHVAGWCDQVFALARGRLTELATRPRPVGTGGRGSHLPVGGQAAIFAAGDRTTGNRTARAVAVPETHSRLDRLPVGSGAGV
jgi:energy-coupling factor transporter ATP-binding protein EcfA2